MKKNTIHSTDFFDDWLDGLDPAPQGRVKRRIKRAEKGNFGDCDSVGDGVSEMRLHFGPGYRLYYFQRKEDLYLLLAGGVKDTQPSDIKLARAIKKEIEGSNKW